MDEIEVIDYKDLDATVSPEKKEDTPEVDYKQVSKSPNISRVDVGLTGIGESQYDDNIPLASLPNLQQIRANRQGGLDQFANALGKGVVNGLLTTLETASYIVDAPANLISMTQGQALTSNWLADLAKSGKVGMHETLPIYRKNNNLIDFSDSGFYWDAFSGVVDSAVGFGLTGLGAGALVKGVGGLLKISDAATKASRAQWMANRLGAMLQEGKAGTVGTAFLQNMGESTMMGLETYESTYNHILPELVDNFKKSNNQREPNPEELKKLASLASAQAGKAANTNFLYNQLFLASNIVQLNALHKAKGLIEKPDLRSFLKSQAKGAPIEGLEEIGQSIASKEAQFTIEDELKEENLSKYGIDNLEYVAPVSFEKDFISRLIEFGTSEQALLEGAMGLVSGPIQYTVTQLPFQNFAKQKEQYNNQQEAIAGIKEFFENSNRSFVETQDLKAKLVETGYAGAAASLEDGEFDNLVVRNMGSNTDSQIQSILEENLNKEETTEEDKKYFQQKLDRLAEIKTTYNKNKKYGDPLNATFNQLEIERLKKVKKLNDELKGEHSEKLQETLQTYVDNYNLKKTDSEEDITVGQVLDKITNQKLNTEDRNRLNTINEELQTNRKTIEIEGIELPVSLSKEDRENLNKEKKEILDNHINSNFEGLPKTFTKFYKAGLKKNSSNYFLNSQVDINSASNIALDKRVQIQQELTDANAQQSFLKRNAIINSNISLEDKAVQIQELYDTVNDTKKQSSKNPVIKALKENTTLRQLVNRTKAQIDKDLKVELKKEDDISKESSTSSVSAKKENVKTTPKLDEETATIKAEVVGKLYKNGNDELSNKISNLHSKEEIDSFIEEYQDQIEAENYTGKEEFDDTKPSVLDESAFEETTKLNQNKEDFSFEIKPSVEEQIETTDVIQQTNLSEDEVHSYDDVTASVNNSIYKAQTENSGVDKLPHVKIANSGKTASKEFIDWTKNGYDKSGTKVHYIIDEDWNQKNKPELYNDYLKLKEQIKTGNIDKLLLDKVANKIAIKIIIDEHLGKEFGEKYSSVVFEPKPDDEYSHLSIQEIEKIDEQGTRAFRAEMQLRRQILINLSLGNKAEGEIKGQYGGELLTEATNKNINLIPDFSTIDTENIPIYVTDKNGIIIDDNADPVTDFRGLEVKHNDKKLAGAIFTSVKKNNGQQFPLKLNIKPYNNNEIRLLRNVYGFLLDPKNKKQNLYDAPINQEMAALLSKADLEFLKGKKESLPTYSQVLKHLVHEGEVSKRNDATQLYLKDGKLHFGGEEATHETYHSKMQAFHDFLQNFKRPNINIRRMGSEPAYKKFIIDNGYLLTDAVIDPNASTLFSQRTDNLTNQTNRHFGGFIFTDNKLTNSKEVKVKEETVSNDQSSIEDKKAAVEKRRKEELDNKVYKKETENKNKIIPINNKTELQKEGKRIYLSLPSDDGRFPDVSFENNSLKSYYQVILNEDGKSGIIRINENNENAINRLTSQGDSGIKPICEIINPEEDHLRQLKTIESGNIILQNGVWKVTKKIKARYVSNSATELSKEDIESISENNLKKDIIDFEKIKQEINAKYDAELKALEQSSTKSQEIKQDNPSSVSIKPGVEELFESNSTLAEIGTKEQYSKYLDTIFPDSKVKDIVYHGTGSDYINKKGFTKQKYNVIYFTPDRDYANKFRDKGVESLGGMGYLHYVSLNIQKLKDINIVGNGELKDVINDLQTGNLDSITGFEKGYNNKNNLFNKPIRSFGVYKPEQIHILGSKQDIEGFKKFNKKTSNSKNKELTLSAQKVIENISNSNTIKSMGVNIKPPVREPKGERKRTVLLKKVEELKEEKCNKGLKNKTKSK